MITAEKSALLSRLVGAYFHRKIRRSFAAVHLKGAEHVSDTRPQVPLVLYANHPGWWDAVLPVILSNQVFRHDAYAMMEEKQMKQYGFFRRLGCFSVVREDPREAVRSLRYAADLLRGTSRVLWIFPQGTLTAAERRPLRFYNGTAHLLRDLGEVTAVPVAFRYEFVEQERPEVFIACGKPWYIHAEERVDIDLTTHLLEELMEYELDVQREEIMERDLDAYATVIQGIRSVNERWDAVRGRR
ncbi:MAG: lysophospholipid acyltransferase family protein [Bacteroidetes bacterium]|nr:lysophospholipid acyltransferase family protein [Bacteroidota bacterium]